MGEYAEVGGQRIKIGTCEKMDVFALFIYRAGRFPAVLRAIHKPTTRAEFDTLSGLVARMVFGSALGALRALRLS